MAKSIGKKTTAKATASKPPRPPRGGSSKPTPRPASSAAAASATATKVKPVAAKAASPAARVRPSAKPQAAKVGSAAGSAAGGAVASPAPARAVPGPSKRDNGSRRDKAAARDRGDLRPPGSVPQNLAMLDAVPTDGKPRKNQAGLSMRDLEHFRDLLLDKRRELVGDMSAMEREALRSSGGTNLSNLPIHMADMGTDNYEQEFTLGLVEKERNLLREINAALAKIQNGTYGLCEGTGQPIGRPRLEAQPWARYSIEYASKVQRNFGRRMEL